MSWTIQNAILVPYDFSGHSHEAVEKAMKIVDNPGQIHILHVLPTYTALAPAGFKMAALQTHRDAALALLAVRSIEVLAAAAKTSVQQCA